MQSVAFQVTHTENCHTEDTMGFTGGYLKKNKNLLKDILGYLGDIQILLRVVIIISNHSVFPFSMQ